ncbi:3-oxo-tetronate 4-phosphate decarboxylase [uncultured Cohaesibacter sp.]|uniref:3-oxo-tetronate 4-phosphate decarboxylase n=1 Tax=uncultured Cohaesibacter sp. TaxID=1002546 RepID=UPI00292CC264|nr:3-oxo-tetronate 4-phosphate decarboxylase [uncultured Cohaesibacter sp.]
MNSYSHAREEMVRLGKYLQDRQLAQGTSGNLSIRLEDGNVLCTPTNSCLGDLNPERLSLLDLQGNHIGGDKPTKESLFHMALYSAREKAQAVVHLHSTNCVAIACQRHANEKDVFQPLTPYYVMKIGSLPLLPYFAPGDAALAAAVGDCAVSHKAMLLANHGPVVSGSSLQDAVMCYEELEETAKLSLLLKNSQVSPLSAGQVAELRRRFPD